MNVYVRLAVEFLLMLNGFLASMGITAFENVTGNQIYLIVSLVAALGAFGYGIWKNHNFTDAAKAAQAVLDGYKSGEINIEDTGDKVALVIDKHSNASDGGEEK